MWRELCLKHMYHLQCNHIHSKMDLWHNTTTPCVLGTPKCRELMVSYINILLCCTLSARLTTFYTHRIGKTHMNLGFYAYCLHPELKFPGFLIKLEKSLRNNLYTFNNNTKQTTNKNIAETKNTCSKNSLAVYFFLSLFVPIIHVCCGKLGK